MDYTSFIYKNKDFARSLYELYASCKEEFPQNAESYLYNLGTMDRDADNPVNGNIVLANAKAFKTALMRYKASNPQMDEVEAKARVVFDFLLSVLLFIQILCCPSTCYLILLRSSFRSSSHFF